MRQLVRHDTVIFGTLCFAFRRQRLDHRKPGLWALELFRQNIFDFGVFLGQL